MNMPLMQVLFGFQGRIRRTTYWLARLGVIAAFIAFVLVVGGIFAAVAAASGGNGDSPNAAAAIVVLFLLLVCLAAYGAAIWIGLAIEVKRCHDRDKTGWFVLVYALVSMTGIGALWPFIELGFMDGTPGPNQYGPSPKELGAPGIAAAPAPNVYT